MKDKYTAVWLSHSSIKDYLKCPQAYYLNNIYRKPETGHKIMLMQPPLALGQVVHEVIEEMSKLPAAERLRESPLKIYERLWKKVSGKMGGFRSLDEETKYQKRGQEMVQRLIDNPGPLLKKIIKIREELPYFWLSEEENLILCGKIDWLEYLPQTDSVRILDFKTGKFDEDPDSLQLPIYNLLVTNCQKRSVTGASYWYLDRDDEPRLVKLPDLDSSYKRVMEIAQKIALARKLEHFKCRQKDGCRACLPLERIVAGQAEYVAVGEYKKDIYILN
ncbi:MAG: hypothetical protein UV61_C0002G0136 [Candidatus Gottesmanbacteria bacterium GW2011_GWB1_43_11]|uniref:PD-(D/E)XK endonuclease-like domain-containing protein n=1 Tax=Candidatus Gottesmanbacteria bacterium GW2011_GWB1_43_11 TaxID=1618446 RepID=A0A0G1CNR7_9BACT|nr:MAG: hypothetical protein UV04_C0001G0024 [Candidatus Gottesmanbacteria bacterium GW2011_GWA2_42_16]KKS56212.1 MAG: hypothetical protein UV17_C0001G0022 [Candidatus Gottesmanbacteria bacterium GW2011_GWA1_42_26]KKS82546.1 MAG: hypothetical protein UV55_C0001G0006 [Candidatus Gottesmanbacteria bacterium GW2011_GWC1_43_10]KKS87415.1 MAG: hypothetical protein UV61_C0002G0136 [Candidatus Gottesmanbacteria bacterium GW2011_GWB1_43_11]OGG10210.1 MAG: hypothetical protein A2699_01525 [Candidatus Go